MSDRRTVAYFSMEIALDAGIPTYSGGLGVLAGR
jgi:starch phosphorylase